MRPIFPRKNLAINHLIEFREGKNIFDFTDYIRRPEEERSGWDKDNLEFQYNHAIDLFDYLKDEINQTIHTSNDKTIIALFEELKKDIKDYDLLNIDKSYFEKVASDWNKKIYKEFIDKVTEKENAYFEQPERKLKHLEKYDKSNWSWLTHKVETFSYENKNFYCIEQVPELIDLSVLDKYLKILSYVTEKFENAINSELKLYNEDKLISQINQESNYDKAIKTLKNNKIVVVIGIIFIIYGAISSIIKDTNDNKENIKKLFPTDTVSTIKENPKNLNTNKVDSLQASKKPKK